jgi:hypothetical protein
MVAKARHNKCTLGPQGVKLAPWPATPLFIEGSGKLAIWELNLWLYVLAVGPPGPTVGANNSFNGYFISLLSGGPLVPTSEQIWCDKNFTGGSVNNHQKTLVLNPNHLQRKR